MVICEKCKLKIDADENYPKTIVNVYGVPKDKNWSIGWIVPAHPQEKCEICNKDIENEKIFKTEKLD